MKIGAIGAGNVGGTLAKLWREAGHDVRAQLLAVQVLCAALVGGVSSKWPVWGVPRCAHGRSCRSVRRPVCETMRVARDVGGTDLGIGGLTPTALSWSPRALTGAEVLFGQVVDAGATVACRVGEEHAWRPGRIIDPFGHELEIGAPLGGWSPR